MQKVPAASVSSGQTAPTIMGPDKDFKEIYVVSGLVLFLAVVVAAFWYSSQSDEIQNDRSADALNGAHISQVIKNQTDPMPISAPAPAIHVEAAPLAGRASDVVHDDIFFEIGRKGLTDDGKAALLRHAELLKNEPDWGVLLQGYTDQQGSTSYNKVLGLKRAETVKRQLVDLGVPEGSIRTVSLGEEGALCRDTSDICRRMNRRVHLELRRIGSEHMIIPAIAPPVLAPVLTDPQAFIEPGTQAGEDLGTGAGPLESTTSLPEPDAALMIEESTVPTSAQ
ncbi:OmpA family protein [Nitrospira sp. Nam80]